MKKNSKYQWTVFFIIEAIDEHWHEAKKMLEEIRNCPINDNVALIVCLNSRMGLLEKMDLGYIKSRSLIGYKKTTVFFKLTTEGKNNRYKFLGEKKNFNIRRIKDVKEYFAKRILKHNTAEKYVLFTWDHGSVFGVFQSGKLKDTALFDLHGTLPAIKKDDYIIYLVSNSLRIPVVRYTNSDNNFKLFHAAFSGDSGNSRDRKISIRKVFQHHKISLVEKENDLLSADEIANALKQAFKRKIDILIMMNCCMQFLDTGYALRNNVRFLIAPETIMNFKGYNYQGMFETLFTNHQISAEEFAVKTIDLYKGKKYEDEGLQKLVLSTSAIFANDLSHYSELVELINKLSKKLIVMLEDETKVKIIESARQKCTYLPDVSAYPLIDFFTFLEILSNENLLFKNDADIERLLSFKKEIVRNWHVGETLIESENKKVSPSAFSVFFPEDLSDNSGTFCRLVMTDNKKYTTSFAQKYSWNDFVHLYTKKVVDREN